MVCSSDRCLQALVIALYLVVGPTTGKAQGLLKASFGAADGQSVAFLVGNGREAVTLGVSGRDLGSAKLIGVAAQPTARVADPVSRLVVFKMTKSHAGSYRLARRAPLRELLRAPGGAPGAKVVAKVEQVSGKYLPFSLLKLRYDGDPPVPGTPLLDGTGAVAAVAHEAMGGNTGYAVPVEVLHRALEAARQGRRIQRAWVGLSMNPASGSPRVTRTVANSPAASAGLKAGDVLLEVGGVGIEDYGDAVNAFFLLRPGKATRIRFKRGGQEMSLDLIPKGSKS